MQLFTRDNEFSCHSIVDERSAAYVALGMARELDEPVVVLTTSGTAALNLGPAVAEAYFQNIPLIIYLHCGLRLSVDPVLPAKLLFVHFP